MSKWRPEGWGNPYTVNPQAKDYPKNAFEQGANAMLEAVCEEIEKVENLFEAEMLAGHGGRYNGYQKAKQDILTLLRSKGGQPVGPGMWGECPTGPTGAEGPPGLSDGET